MSICQGFINTKAGLTILESKLPKNKIIVASDWACRGPHLEAMLADFEKFYGDLLSVLRSTDLAIVNVETTFSEKGNPILKAGPNISCPKEMVKGLQVVPFHVACLANNHTRDFDSEGLQETIRIIEEADLHATGVGSSEKEIVKPLILDLKGTKIGIINVAEGEACLPPYKGAPGVASLDLARIKKQLMELTENVDFKMVIVHAGREYAPVPPPYIQESYQQLVRDGADLIIGHHPHVPQGIEIYRGVPIIYSLGNFAFWQDNDNPYQHIGFLVELELVGSRLSQLKLIPYSVQPEGLSLLESEEEKQFYSDLELVSEVLYDPKKVVQLWEAFADVHYERKGETQLLLDYSTPLQGARSKNFFITKAHSEIMITIMERIQYKTIGTSPEWAKQIVRKWIGMSE